MVTKKKKPMTRKFAKRILSLRARGYTFRKIDSLHFGPGVQHFGEKLYNEALNTLCGGNKEVSRRLNKVVENIAASPKVRAISKNLLT